jgi:hypothetical protein
MGVVLFEEPEFHAEIRREDRRVTQGKQRGKKQREQRQRKEQILRIRKSFLLCVSPRSSLRISA